MTSTPDPSEGAASPEGAPVEHRIPEPEAGEGELPESAAPESFVDAPLEHATHEQAEAPAAQPQPQPEPTTPTLEELELALAALDEVAPKGAVGEVHDALAEGGAHGQAQVVAIRHVSTLGGYPDWLWTVLLSRGLEGGPTVLEVALLPGETSLLAPAWVPWSERLADYLAAKDAEESDADDEDDEDLDSDLEADLDDDFDDDFDVEDAVADDDEDDDADWDDEAESDAEPDDSRA
ncbi:DUF3027 domain-containing protein [Agrococcus baldri]|uniref:DUF3027 domain-containing protein n=1 Tax=Agrococcus baldri TaxID=153730 RepID=A0AA87RB14_9MICO|nr:DUF3027 domain-containing protein [Agrococcus baldri]GEK79760.1 hypothetical protein ABA31_11110 [Agrococcus baldri]